MNVEAIDWKSGQLDGRLLSRLNCRPTSACPIRLIRGFMSGQVKQACDNKDLICYFADTKAHVGHIGKHKDTWRHTGRHRNTQGLTATCRHNTKPQGHIYRNALKHT